LRGRFPRTPACVGEGLNGVPPAGRRIQERMRSGRARPRLSLTSSTDWCRYPRARAVSAIHKQVTRHDLHRDRTSPCEPQAMLVLGNP
jgi:hypothetical protein